MDFTVRTLDSLLLTLPQFVHCIMDLLSSNVVSDKLFLSLCLRFWMAAAAVVVLGGIYDCTFLVQGLYRRKQLCLRATNGSMLLIIGINALLAPSPHFCESCLATV